MSVRAKRRKILRRCQRSLKEIPDTTYWASQDDDSSDGTKYDGDISHLSTVVSHSDESDANSDISSRSTDSSNDWSDENPNEMTLLTDLRDFAITTNQTFASMNILLQKLQKYHPHLPKDARTLLQSKPNDALFKNVSPGQYYHFGLVNGLNFFVSHENTKEKFHVKLNIDGLQLFKSTVSGFWPILAEIQEIPHSVFIVGLYYGERKPDSPSEFLNDLISELKFLESSDTLPCAFEVAMCCCDIPAKKIVKATKGHSGFYSCERCVQKGRFVNGRMIFPETNADLRTDDSFRSRMQIEHHKGLSPFEDLPTIDMINFFPIDYMHCALKGLFLKLLEQLKSGAKPYKLNEHNLRCINSDISNYRSQIPSDFTRKPRSLNHLSLWKATEMRLFGLYIGPVVLKPYVKKEFFDLFMSLSVVVRILCHPVWSRTMSGYAFDLTKVFLSNSCKILGESFVTLNVHYLLHLVKDCERLGCADSFSCFPFENFMRFLKRAIRSPHLPLQQAVGRILERGQDLGQFRMRTPAVQSSSKKCGFRNSILTVKGPDRYILTKESEILKLTSIEAHDKEFIFYGRVLTGKVDAFQNPLPSSNLQIYRGEIFDRRISRVPSNSVLCKIFKIDDVFFPILHTY